MKTRLLIAAVFSLVFFLSMVLVARHWQARLDEIVDQQNAALSQVQAAKRAAK